MTDRHTLKTRAASSTAARGSAPPDADPAGVPAPVPGTPATSSRQAVSPDSTPDGRPGPETTRPGPVSARAGDSSPAGVPTPRAGGTPAGSNRLRGAEALKAIQQAQARARRGPAVRKPAATKTALPAAASGASLTAAATCLNGCGWTAGPGDPAEVDKAAERHTTKAPKHATSAWAEPVRGAA